MKALTVLQPWAHAIAVLGKDIENRGWRPPRDLIGERIAIHAGLRWIGESRRQALLPSGVMVLADSCLYGAIIAVAVIDRVVSLEDDDEANVSLWRDSAEFGWVLRDIQRLPMPIAALGHQGLWNLSDEQEDLVIRQTYWSDFESALHELQDHHCIVIQEELLAAEN